MSDSVSLRIAGRSVTRFESYRVSADIFTAADAFSLELSDPEVRVTPGAICELYVNGTPELVGVVDKIGKSYSKSGVRLNLEGRDLMGVLVDSCCEKFITVQNIKLSALAKTLLSNIPAPYRPRGIIYQKDLTSRIKGRKSKNDNPFILDSDQKIGRITPGMTVFEVLSNAARSRGLLFWANADGTMEFGRPKVGGEAMFSLSCLKTGEGNIIMQGDLSRNIALHYSKVTVITQSQGFDSLGSSSVNVKKSLTDPLYPFYKPLVRTMSDDSVSPALYARLLMEKMRNDGFRLEYQVPGHTLNGRNWKINELCRVNDEVLEVSGAYLIYGRTFERSKTGGTTTRLQLSLPGKISGYIIT